MQFEDILAKVGDFGRYQRALSAALFPAFVSFPWFCMNIIFLSATPDHWCRIPEVSGSNLSLEEQKRLVRPPSDPSCSAHDVDYAVLLRSGNRTVRPDWPTRPCEHGWQFDDSEYDATAATRWGLVCGDAHYVSLLLSLAFVGDVVGTPLYGYAADRWGRKKVFLFLAALTSASEIGSVLSPSFPAFLFLRALNGSSMSTMYGVAYVILLELVRPDRRALANGVSVTAWTAGLCSLPLVAWITRNWLYLSACCAAASLLQLCYWKILPESPSWLVSQERYEEAEKIMARIGRVNGKTAENKNLRAHLQVLGDRLRKVREDRPSPLDFFRYPELRRRFLLVTACWVANSITYFGLQMNVRNLSGSQFLNFFLVSVVELPAHLATWVFMQRFGRRWCSVVAFLVSGAACLGPPLVATGAGVAASLLGKAGSSSAFMTLYQQCPELYPTPLRSFGMGLSCTVATVSSLSVPYVVDLARYGKSVPFLTFSAVSLAGAACASFLPETLDRKMPQSVADAENFSGKSDFFSCSNRTASVVEVDPSTLPTD